MCKPLDAADESTLYTRIKQALAQKKIEQAQDLLARWLSKNPRDTKALALKAWVHFEHNQFTDTLRLYQQILELEPNNTRILNQMGMLLYRMAEPEKALPYLTHLICLEPHHGEGHENLGEALFLTQQFSAAYLHYLPGFKLKMSKYFTDEMPPAVTLTSLQDFQDYLTSCLLMSHVNSRSEICQQLLKINPKNALAQKVSDSLSDLCTAIRKEAHHFYCQGNFAQAAEGYRVLLDQDPTDADALHALGLTLWKMGQAANAMALIERAIRAEPQKHQYYLDLGNILAAQGQLEQALQLWQQAIQYSVRR